MMVLPVEELPTRIVAADKVVTQLRTTTIRHLCVLLQFNRLAKDDGLQRPCLSVCLPARLPIRCHNHNHNHYFQY